MPAKDPERRRATVRAWYQRNKERLAERDAEKRRTWRRSARASLAQWYDELKARLFCARCGEAHPGCLQFRHRDPAAKEVSVSIAMSRSWGRERVLREIEKCEVLCANCHMKHHAGEDAAC